MYENPTEFVGGPFIGSEGQACELLYIHLVGGPLDGKLVLSMRANGKLAQWRQCFTARGTAAIYYPWRCTDTSLRPVFRFDREVVLHGHHVLN